MSDVASGAGEVVARGGSGVLGAPAAEGVDATPQRRLPGTGRKYGGLTPEERRAQRREKLLAAGLELFGTTGFAGTTIDGICAAAGVTARHFYQEFSSREDLMRAVFDRAIGDAMAMINEAVAERAGTGRTPEARVRDGVEAFLHAFLDDPRRARVICVESAGVSSTLEYHRIDVNRGMARVLDAQARSMLPPHVIDADMLTITTRAIVGGANSAIVDWLLAEDPPPLRVLSRAVGNLFLGVLEYYRIRFDASGTDGGGAPG